MTEKSPRKGVKQRIKEALTSQPQKETLQVFEATKEGELIRVPQEEAGRLISDIVPKTILEETSPDLEIDEVPIVPPSTLLNSDSLMDLAQKRLGMNRSKIQVNESLIEITDPTLPTPTDIPVGIPPETAVVFLENHIMPDGNEIRAVAHTFDGGVEFELKDIARTGFIPAPTEELRPEA